MPILGPLARERRLRPHHPARPGKSGAGQSPAAAYRQCRHQDVETAWHTATKPPAFVAS